MGGGGRVGRDPAAEVRRAEPERGAGGRARRLRSGKSAAPLARRHPGLVPPLIVQAWPAAAAASLLAGRPPTPLAPYSARTRPPVRPLRGWGVPAPGVPRPTARPRPRGRRGARPAWI